MCVCSCPPASFSEENGKQIKKARQLEDQWKTAISLKVSLLLSFKGFARSENVILQSPLHMSVSKENKDTKMMM